jgi:NADH-quinone oxidoreductase subunit M
MRDAVIPIVALLCVIGIIYGALVAWVQQDFKKLVAYSSVSHLGFCVLGLLALNTTGVQGGVFYMISHGISTGALFLMIGMIYDRYHTRMFKDYGGLGRIMPVFSFFLVLFAMSSIGLPGTNGFISEFLSILGAFTSPYLGPWFGSAAAIGVILGAVYMLHFVAKLVFGPLKIPETHAAGTHAFDAVPDAQLAGEPAPEHLPRDLNAREIGLLAPLALAVIFLGVVPNTVLRTILPDVEQARTPTLIKPNTAAERRPAAPDTGGPEGGASPSSIGVDRR